MVFADKMHKITDALDKGGLVVLPTDAERSIAFNIQRADALKKVVAMWPNPAQAEITLLANSIEMAKKYFPKLHPRIETLMVYHQRPLTVTELSRNARLPEHLLALDRRIRFRVCQDTFCNKIIDLMAEPIAVSRLPALLRKAGTYHAHNTELYRHIDYVCQHRATDENFEAEVVISYDRNGELKFERT